MGYSKIHFSGDAYTCFGRFCFLCIDFFFISISDELCIETFIDILFPLLGRGHGLMVINCFMQYFLPSKKQRINQLIEDSILDAEEQGAKVIGLGLLNTVYI